MHDQQAYESQGPLPENIHTLIFDLDGTLYPLENGYSRHVRDRLFQYMQECLGIKDPKRVWWPLFSKYNQTLKALREGAGYEINDEEYWAYIREGVDRFCADTPDLRTLLQSLPQSKYVLTNCAEKQAQECLKCLGIEKEFVKVYGADFMKPYCKPDQEAFTRVLEDIGVNPKNVAMFEDSYKNLKAAHELGMTTVFITSVTAAEEGVTTEDLSVVDCVLNNVETAEARARAPWLWTAVKPN